MLDVVLVFDVTYFQKSFGFSFTCLAMFFSLSFTEFLVSI